jgi:hypothetical protein
VSSEGARCSEGACSEGVESSCGAGTICLGALIWGRLVVFFLRNDTMPFAFSDMLAWSVVGVDADVSKVGVDWGVDRVSKLS